MSMLISTVIFLLVLTLIVSIHEAGHFVSARKFGVYCKEFAIGMGTKIWSKQKGETEYSIRMLPMGGFVQMIGEDGEAFQIEAGDNVWLKLAENGHIKQLDYQQPVDDSAMLVQFQSLSKKVSPMMMTYTIDEKHHTTQVEELLICYDNEKQEQWLVADNRRFSNLHPLKKIVILSAGVFMNFILGFILVFLSVWSSGVYVTPTIATDSYAIGAVNDFHLGDEIKAVNGQEFATINELSAYIQAHPNTEVEVVVERLSETGESMQRVTLQRTIHEVEEQKLTASGVVNGTRGILGVTYQRNHTAIFTILSEALTQYISLFQYIFFVLLALFSGSIKITNLTGFIGIAQQTNAIVTASTASTTIFTQFFEVFGRVLNFAAFLSVNIGVMNILPFPALDGGRIVFAIYELIFQRKAHPKLETYINVIGFIALILLFIGITVMDVMRLFQ